MWARGKRWRTQDEDGRMLGCVASRRIQHVSSLEEPTRRLNGTTTCAMSSAEPSHFTSSHILNYLVRTRYALRNIKFIQNSNPIIQCKSFSLYETVPILYQHINSMVRRNHFSTLPIVDFRFKSCLNTYFQRFMPTFWSRYRVIFTAIEP